MQDQQVLNNRGGLHETRFCCISEEAGFLCCPSFLYVECSVQYRAVDPNSQNVLSITWIGSPSHPCMVKLNGIRCITIRPENLNLSGIIGADSIFRLQKLKSGELGLEQHQMNYPTLNFALHKLDTFKYKRLFTYQFLCDSK